MALLEPRAFSVQLDSPGVNAGDFVRGALVARKSFPVSVFQVILSQNLETIATVLVPAPGRLNKGESLRFEVLTPVVAAPSMATELASVSWNVMVFRGTEGVRMAKTVEVFLARAVQQFDLNGFEHPEVLRVAHNWERLTSRSRFSFNWSKAMTGAPGQNRPYVPEALDAGQVLRAPIAQWLGESVPVEVRLGDGPVSLGLICTLFRNVGGDDGAPGYLESFILHEEWQKVVSDATIGFRMPRRGVPTHGAGPSAVHWTLEARGPGNELIERRPVYALAGLDFDERLIDFSPQPAVRV